jgi:hypothetical protein
MDRRRPAAGEWPREIPSGGKPIKKTTALRLEMDD